MTKKNAFGITWEPPDRDTAVTQYMNRCAYKVRLAVYHLAEFERLEAELTGADFFDFEGAPFVPVQAHADGVLLQLAAAFDAFACAVAHRHGLDNPDKADLAGWHDRLLRGAHPDLVAAITAVRAAAQFAELGDYRNLAAHRGVIGELMRGTQGPDGGDEVRLLLPDWLPEHFPDYPEAYVGPILHRYLDWGADAIEYLRRTAAGVWDLDEASDEHRGDLAEPALALRGGDMEGTVGSEIEVATPESLAPRFGEWKAWFSWGSHDFATGATDPPAWFLRRGEEPAVRLDAAEIEVDDLSSWLQETAGTEAAKSVLRWSRPRYEHGTAFGRLLRPGRHG